jgi:hypothetical protein
MTAILLDCGHQASPHSDCTTATGHFDGRELCWDCCNEIEREAFAKAQHYTAYLSGGGKQITTWPGGVLATVTALWAVRNNFAGEILRIRCVAPDSSQWYGTAPGRGMYCRLHRSNREA